MGGNHRAVVVRRMRSMMERSMTLTVAATASMSTTFVTLRFCGIRQIDAQDGDFDAAVRQLAQQDVYVEILTDDDIRQGLILAVLAHAGAVSDLQHIGEVIDLQGDGFAVLVHGHNLAIELLLDRLLGRGGRGGGGCGRGRLGILRP
jgi:hypothetical protein